MFWILLIISFYYIFPYYECCQMDISPLGLVYF
jgi:hypothetical protein